MREDAASAAAPRGHERWSSRLGFVLATIGSAIGLGSIWKFPYEVGANGGSVFILFYLLGLGLIVLPLMLVEFAIGRRGGGDASASMRQVAVAAGASPRWALAGLLGIVTSFLVLSFYSVIGGWTIAYLVESVRLGVPSADMRSAQARFDALMQSPARMIMYHTLFVALTALIVARGIVGGIERACMVLMPALAVLILLLAVYSVLTGDAAAALRFMFAPEWSRLTPQVALEALGLGFFSIGVGLAVMITYASHAGPELSLRQVAVHSVLADTAISFLAGLAIFPVVFAHGLSPSSGPGLMFVSLPIAFAQAPFGAFAAVTFFLLLAVAALSSAISMLEMPVAWLQRRSGLRRPVATLTAAAACWLLGLASVFSFNIWARWFPLAQLPAFARATLFDLLDHLTSNLLLPLSGFALAVFGGWVAHATLLPTELGLAPNAARAMRWLLRYLVPAAIAAVTLSPFVF